MAVWSGFFWILLENRERSLDIFSECHSPVITYKAKSTPFATEPISLNSAGSVVGQTASVLDADAGILQPDAGAIL
jgi:hypothetical protein